MRIKKKHVILESLLIDISTEFNNTEKKILKLLNKQYGNPYGPGNNFNQWEISVWLIEELELPYDMAYEITKTYYWNYDKLFRETESLRQRIPMGELFFDNVSKLMSNFKTEIGETYGNVNVTFNKEEEIVDEREVHFWDRYNGFGLYIPFSQYRVNDRYLDIEERNNRLMIVDVSFKPIDKDGNVVDGWVGSKKYEDEIDNEYFSVNVTYHIGDNPENKKELIDFKVKYPKPLTKNSFNEMVKVIVDDVKIKINNTKFDLPNGVTPLM
jgi:hypothetical protein